MSRVPPDHRPTVPMRVRTAASRLAERVDRIPTSSFGVGLCLFVTLLFTGAYLSVQFLPGNQDSYVGWWAWFDQERYLASVQALGRGDLRPEAHHYPPGYPALGVPFVGVLPRHCFFFPNLAAAVSTAAVVYGLARRFFGRTESCVVLGAITWSCRGALIPSAVLPWSTVPTHAATLVCVYLFLTRSPSAAVVVRLAALDAFVFWCRPLDAVLLAPILIASVLQLPDWPSRAKAAGWGLGVALAGPLGLVAWNLAVFGLPVSPYARFMASEIGFFDYGLGLKAYGVLADGYPIYRETSPVLLETMPWLVMAVPGALVAVRTLGGRAVIAGVVMATSAVAYIGYNNMSPVALTRFSLVHYFAWLFPLGGLLAYLTVRRALWTERPALTVPALLVPIALLWTVRLEETDGYRTTTDDRGHVVAGAAAEGRYDLVVIRGMPQSDGFELEADGTPLARPRDLHLRRDYDRRTNFEGYAIVFAQPRDPSTLRFTHPSMQNRPVEFRRLRFAVTPLPPMIHKIREGRAWGADSLRSMARYPAQDLGSAVGHRAPNGNLETTGRAGMLQYGPYVDLLPGAYSVTWFGSAPEGADFVVDVTAGRGERSLVRRRVRARTGRREGPLCGLEFELSEPATEVEFRLEVPAHADLRLSRVELAPATD